MIETLRSKWKGPPSWRDVITLAERLDAMLQTIRHEQNILPPLMTCPKCKTRYRAAASRVSVRAMLLALGRFGIAGSDEVRTLEKAWKQYQEDNALDLYGKNIAEASPSSSCCDGG
jgi:hypothetical protein